MWTTAHTTLAKRLSEDIVSYPYLYAIKNLGTYIHKYIALKLYVYTFIKKSSNIHTHKFIYTFTHTYKHNENNSAAKL